MAKGKPEEWNFLYLVTVRAIYIYIDRLNEGEGGYKGKKGLFDIFTIIITKSNCEPIHYIYI